VAGAFFCARERKRAHTGREPPSRDALFWWRRPSPNRAALQQPAGGRHATARPSRRHAVAF
jgi:hypothetical protein